MVVWWRRMLAGWRWIVLMLVEVVVDLDALLSQAVSIDCACWDLV
jgi:hypothetical protein